MHKTMLAPAIRVCWLLLPALSLLAADVTPVGKVARLIPRADLTRTGKTARVKVNQAVAENDRIRTATGGRTRLVLNDGSLINVGSASELVVRVPRGATQASGMDLYYGRVRAWISQRTAGNQFEVRAGTAIAGVLGTTLFVEATRDLTRVANLSTEAGARVRVRSTNPAVTAEVILQPGEGTAVPAGRAPQPPRRWTQEEMQTSFDDTDIQ